MVYVFISYARADHDSVQRLIADLAARGIEVWIDQRGLQPGTPDWDQALRDAIERADAVLLSASPASRRSPYVRDELAIAKMYDKPIYPVWVDGTHWIDSIPMGLGPTQFVDVRADKYAAGVESISAALGGTGIPSVQTQEREALPAAPAPTFTGNPYKGLLPFTADDADRFFGREVFVESLTNDTAARLAPGQPRLLALVGASGSGKSSVMMAGLIPALQAGKLPGSEGWVYLERAVPGRNPLEQLSEVIAAKLPQISMTALDEDLHNPNGRGLHRLAKRLAGDVPNRRVVLYIDQFEELFLLTTDDRARRQFISLLTIAATEPDGPLILLLTLRADFFDRPLAYEPLARLMETCTRPVLPMSLADVYDAVEKPAALAGLTFEDGLARQMVYDVREQIGILPLLQYALTELYQRRDGTTLTHAAYTAIGGITGALARRADELYAQAETGGYADAVREVFLRLVTLGEGTEDTRRRTRLDELAGISPQAQAVLDLYGSGEARLLAFDSDPLTHTPTVDVAHEALLRTWGRLRTWLEESRDALRIVRRLTQEAQEWADSGRDSGLLASGTRLANYQALVTAAQMQFTPLERDFVDASAAAQTRRARSARRTRAALVGLALLLIVAVGGFLALNSVQQADNANRLGTQVARAEANAATATNALGAADANLRQAWNTQSLFLADLSRQQLESGTQHNALLLAMQANQYADEGVYVPEAHQALLNALAYPAAREVAYLRHDGSVSAVWNADETRILSWSGTDSSFDNTVRVWDAASGDELLTLRHEGSVHRAAWNADGSRILSWSSDDTVRVWDAASGQQLLTLRHADYVVVGAAWNADETRILSWSDDDTVRVWDAVSGDELLTLRHADFVVGAAWNADESRILSWSDDDDTVRVWDAASGDELLTLRHADYVVVGAAWNADESRILSWSGDGTAHVWDAASGENLLALDDVGRAAWNADGTRILTLSGDGGAGAAGRGLVGDGTARVWVVGLEALLDIGERTVIRDFSNEEREQFFLPTVEPTATVFVPSVTPLPTLTPSATGQPSITPLPTLTPSATPTP